MSLTESIVTLATGIISSFVDVDTMHCYASMA